MIKTVTRIWTKTATETVRGSGTGIRIENETATWTGIAAGRGVALRQL